jgi:hypothetical protein
MKRCFKCLCEKSLSDFYKHAQMGDGHLNKCKECTKADVKLHRQEQWERVRAYDRARASQPHRVAQRREIVNRWYANYPGRKKAQAALRYAVLSGKVKPQPCWVCGAKAEAHHPDYSQPLDVVWLCPPHHKQTHALVANDPELREVA